jgi:glycine/D-amino acid oxidase-like deaminating enzyme
MSGPADASPLHRAVVVGGGVAGLGCARRLAELGASDFVVVADELGGRCPTSHDGRVNYGAFYVRQDYRHMRGFVKQKRRMRLRDMSFAANGDTRPLLHVRSAADLLPLVRCWRLLQRLLRRWKRLRERCEHTSQARALREDDFLWGLYRKPAMELVAELGAGRWAREVFNPVVWSTAFLDIRQASAVHFASSLLPLVVPSWEFELELERLIAPLFERIERDRVTGIRREGDAWRVDTAAGRTRRARHVVLAVPMDEAARLVPISEETNPPVAVTMTHVRGRLRPGYGHDPYVMLSPEVDDIIVVREPNGTFLHYSRSEAPDLTRYFREHQVIAERRWDPAFFLGTHLVEPDRGDGLLVIGDHNVCSLEDAYVTGIWAANRVLGRA